MNKISPSFSDKNYLGEFLDLESFLGGRASEKMNKIKGFFLGFRKDSIVFDLEKSLVTYLKVLRLVEVCKKSSFSILFVGCPPLIKALVQEKLSDSKHRFIDESSWVLGSLTNPNRSELFPSLIISFNLTCSFPSKESLKKGIPLVSFMDESGDFSFVDYPIFINLKSEGASRMYYNLIKRSI
jgi:ribosomal protein S2